MRALVTGASSGIGLEMAKLLGQRGYHLILTARTAEPMQALAEALPYGATVIPLDLAQPGAARQLFEACRERELEIEVLVNNAGFGKVIRHENLQLSTLTGMCQLNMVALSELCALFGQSMREAGRGYILNVASTAGFFPLPYFANYAATKAFVRSLSLALSHEYEEYGVKVCCLNPGPTITGFGKRAKPRGKELFATTGMAAEEVARQGLDALFSGRREVITGLANTVLARLGAVLPHSLVLKLGAKNFRARLID
ncbi:MAG: SDR family NAD(P)-dependent oxidoreductase [Vulcanimicrobiota bacterium]